MQIFSVSPNGIEQGQKNEITITGDDFVADSTLSFSGTGISVEDLSFPDPDTIIATVEVTKTAEIGLRDVSVVAPDATTVTLAAGIAVTNFQSLTSQLRLLTGERIRPGKTDLDTNFSNDELIDIILRYRGNLYLAAAEVWQAKAAENADLVDIAESGSERKLSQLFKNMSTQSASFRQAGIEIEEQVIDPVVGVSVAWLYPSSTTTSDHSADPFYDPFLFLFAQRTWMPVAFSGSISSDIAMYGGRIL